MHECECMMNRIGGSVGRPAGLWSNVKLTNVSASRNTHFSNCVKRQQCNFVNVMPNSGRDNNAKLAASFESSTFTSWTTLKTVCNFSRIADVTPGVIKTANWCAVLTFFNEKATTIAPNAYESFVANVTHANSVSGIGIDIGERQQCEICHGSKEREKKVII